MRRHAGPGVRTHSWARGSRRGPQRGDECPAGGGWLPCVRRALHPVRKQEALAKSASSPLPRLKEIRRNMVDMMNEQKDRKWDLDDYSKSAIGTGFM